MRASSSPKLLAASAKEVGAASPFSDMLGEWGADSVSTTMSGLGTKALQWFSVGE